MSNEIATQPPALPDVNPAKQQFATLARALVITDQQSLDTAGRYVNAGKQLLADIEAAHRPVVKHWSDMHKRALADLKADREIVEIVVNELSGKVLAYRRAEQQRRDEEAAAERERLRREQEEKALREAAEVEASGDGDLAEAILAEAVEAPVAVSVAPVDVKADGVDIRRSWDFEVVDVQKINAEYVKADEVAIRKIVRASGPAAVRLVGDGIRVFQVETLAKARG